MEKPRKSLDLIIIGGGVTGLTAALYAGRMKLSTLVLEANLVGGQIVNAHEIENYPGFAAIKGSELVEKIEQQAEFFGAVIDEFDTILKVEFTDAKKIVETESFVYEPKAVIIATGMTRRKLPLPEESRFLSKGIHYCELCDGHMYQDKVIAVVGGGNAALDAAKFLTKYAKKLYIIHRSPALTADVLTQDNVLRNPIVEVLLNTEIRAAQGDKILESVLLYDTKAVKEYVLPLDGLFVDIGVVPNTAMFAKDLLMDKAGNIIAGEDCKTNVAGVFAAGDVRTKTIRQLTTAAADGTVAALMAEKYIGK